MTTRTAELLMTLLLGAFSIYLMVKSTELEIGWIRGEGPGGGAWPFWLSAGMLICCVVTLVRWVLRRTPESRSLAPFIDPESAKILLITVATLVVMMIAVHVIGIYFAMMLFMLFYLKVMGRHSWLVTGAFVIGMPIGTFVLFEAALRIFLPKGYSEPLFYPLYQVIY